MRMTAQEGRNGGSGGGSGGGGRTGGQLRKAKQRPVAKAGGVGVIGTTAVDDEHVVARVSACGDGGGLTFDKEHVLRPPVEGCAGPSCDAT